MILYIVIGICAIIMALWISYECGYQAGYRYGSLPPKNATPEDFNDPHNPWNEQQ